MAAVVNDVGALDAAAFDAASRPPRAKLGKTQMLLSQELRAAGFSGQELRTAGYSAAGVREAGIEAGELKTIDFSAKECDDSFRSFRAPSVVASPCRKRV